MAKSAEALAREVKIKYRSSSNLVLRRGILFYNEDMQTVEIECSTRTEDEQTASTMVKLSGVNTVKAMDYIEGTRVNCARVLAAVWALVLILRLKPDTSEDALCNNPSPPQEEEVILQFARVEDRDNWDTGLRFLINALEVTVAKDQVDVPTRGFSRIKKVRLEEPRAGVLVAGRFELANGEEAMLEVTEEMADAKNLNSFIVEWVQQKCVQPSETTSLYRLVKSLVHRVTLDSKTADIIKRINDCHFDRMLQAQGKGTDQGHLVLELTKAHLREIDHEIPKIIGQQGTGASMIIQVLRRNVEKMKVINDLAFKIHMDSYGQSPDSR
ncbi:unnamed protein product [Effrenium voratum]|nr:unnamed protein product [Effrenium voratum]